MQEKNITVALYVRVSSERQADEDRYSIPEQIERLKAYCAAKGWNVYKIYTDGGQSGASIERPALANLITDAGNKKFNMVLVYKLDRLSRKQKDTLYLIEDVFIKNDIDFTSVVENLDTSTPTGRAFIGLLSVFAQLEREQINERMRMGKEGRAKAGKYHAGSTVAIGYDYKDGCLQINEYEAMQVRKVFELRALGYGNRQIETYMIEHGYKHKGRNDDPKSYLWYASTVRRVLTNRIYIGLIKHKNEYYQGEHEPIIDEELFYSLQPALKEASMKFSYSKGPNKQRSLLGGILYCGNCGGKYSFGENTPRHPERYGKIGYYSCYSRSKRVKKMIVDPTCKNKNWRTVDLDNLIIEEIKKLKYTDGYIDSVKSEKGAEDEVQVEQIKKRLSQIDSQISKLMDLYSLGTIDIDIIQSKINPLATEKAKLEQTLHEFQKVKPTALDDETVFSLADQFLEKLSTGTMDEKRALIATLINKIELLDEKIKVYWNF